MSEIIRIRKDSGTKFTVLYLKKSTMLVYHYISGKPTTSGSEVRVATRKGLPLLIPSPLRDLIADKDERTIKVVLGILSIFRVMSFQGTLKLETITDPFNGVSTTLSELEVALAWRRFMKPLVTKVPTGPQFLLNLKTAGPNYRISILGASLDA